jgi:hypothetical protein
LSATRLTRLAINGNQSLSLWHTDVANILCRLTQLQKLDLKDQRLALEVLCSLVRRLPRVKLEPAGVQLTLSHQC